MNRYGLTEFNGTSADTGAGSGEAPRMYGADAVDALLDKKDSEIRHLWEFIRRNVPAWEWKRMAHLNPPSVEPAMACYLKKPYRRTR